jgi:hypothetical protein
VDEIDKPDRRKRPMNLERHDLSNASGVAVRRMLLVASGNAQRQARSIDSFASRTTKDRTYRWDTFRPEDAERPSEEVSPTRASTRASRSPSAP